MFYQAFSSNPAFLAALNIARPIARANGITATDDDVAIIAAAVLAAFAEEGGFKLRSRVAIKAAAAPMLAALMSDDETDEAGAPASTPRSPCPSIPLST